MFLTVDSFWCFIFMCVISIESHALRRKVRFDKVEEGDFCRGRRRWVSHQKLVDAIRDFHAVECDPEWQLGWAQ